MLRLHLPSEQEIQRASLINGLARRTPLWRVEVDCPKTNVYLKLEALQPTGSFKVRGAVNALKQRHSEISSSGVVTPSAGNFGLSLAWAGRELGVRVKIAVPDDEDVPRRDALKKLGAKIERLPRDVWWQMMAMRRADVIEGTFIHPFADNHVIAGNATIAAEILEELPDPSAVVVPFGGGGLLAGIGPVMRRESPVTRVLGAESDTSKPLEAALRARRPTQVTHTPSFVDGIGSTGVQPEMWELLKRVVDGSVRASLAEIIAAIRLMMSRQHIVTEGAGAVAVAATLAGQAGTGDIVCIVSGGNIDPSVLRTVLE